jgi:hypothetical protein
MRHAGVGELLRSVVPLLTDLGLVADWRIIRGDESFFEVTDRGSRVRFLLLTLPRCVPRPPGTLCGKDAR